MTPRGMQRETQPERTALAWQRTGLGMLAMAALLGHGAVEQKHPVLLAVAGAAALLGLGVLGGLAPVRYRQVRRMLTAGGNGRSAPGLLAAATTAVALVGLAAVIAVVVIVTLG